MTSWLHWELKPKRPETGYGYIQIDEEKKGDFYKVKTFIEKPAREFAEIFVQSNEFYWNFWHFCMACQYYTESFSRNDVRNLPTSRM